MQRRMPVLHSLVKHFLPHAKLWEKVTVLFVSHFLFRRARLCVAAVWGPVVSLSEAGYKGLISAAGFNHASFPSWRIPREGLLVSWDVLVSSGRFRQVALWRKKNSSLKWREIVSVSRNRSKFVPQDSWKISVRYVIPIKFTHNLATLHLIKNASNNLKFIYIYRETSHYISITTANL